MKILLDECIPRKFRNSFVDHECHTVPEAGFEGLKNGDLLTRAEKAGFEVFITMDRGLPYQQNLSDRGIAILIIRSRSNRIGDLLTHVEACRSALETLHPGAVIRIGD